MDESQAAITVGELTKRFGDLIAVDHVVFTVTTGEIFCLVGPDGAGKTTTMRMLAGVMAPDSGSATVAGFDVVRDPEGVKNHISYMPQRFGLYEELTVDENIRFYADLFGISRREREPRAEQVLAAAGMSRFRDRLAGQLSGGMKQKLGLSCALIHTPRVLLLDEPTTGVDPVSRRDFWRILYGLASTGVTVLTSTAYLDEAERCHRLALLHKGRILLCDTPAGLKATMPGAVIAVTAPSPTAAREALRDLPGVASVLVVGDGVHLAVDDAQQRVPAIEQRLRTAGVAFAEVTRVAPTIEDLFVASITREQEEQR
ncbi:MAG TPA: ABC transporter ATP-binding protein [Candidatus Binatia bacterium]|nr:ABC transporter ATP-binding protein [Candidatus Binatia bacterium]